MLIPHRKFTELEREQWQLAVFELYERMREKAKRPYDVEYGGLKLTVFPGVYAPEFFDDSLWFGREMQKIVKRRTLLEIGTGTGIIGLMCALEGASVMATDFSREAVNCARINAARYRVDMRVCFGDMYEAVPVSAKFNYIFWAHPFNNWDMPMDDMLLRSGIDPRYESLRAYVRGAKNYLYSGGRLLLGTGDSADIAAIEGIGRENGYRLKLISKSRRPLGTGAALQVTDLLCEFVPQ